MSCINCLFPEVTSSGGCRHELLSVSLQFHKAIIVGVPADLPPVRSLVTLRVRSGRAPRMMDCVEVYPSRSRLGGQRQAALEITARHCKKEMEQYGECVASKPSSWQQECHALKVSVAQCTSSHPVIKRIRQECAEPFLAFEQCLKQNQTSALNCTEHVTRFLTCAEKVSVASEVKIQNAGNIKRTARKSQELLCHHGMSEELLDRFSLACNYSIGVEDYSRCLQECVVS